MELAPIAEAQPGIAAFRLQYYGLIRSPPKMYETVAHFYETIALFFGGRPETRQFCMCDNVQAGVFNACHV